MSEEAAFFAALDDGDIAGAAQILIQLPLAVPRTRTAEHQWPVLEHHGRLVMLAFSSSSLMHSLTRGGVEHSVAATLPELLAALPEGAAGVLLNPGHEREMVLDVDTMISICIPSARELVQAAHPDPVPMLRLLDGRDIDELMRTARPTLSGYVHVAADVMQIPDTALYGAAIGASPPGEPHAFSHALVWDVQIPALYLRSVGRQADQPPGSTRGPIVDVDPIRGTGLSRWALSPVREFHISQLPLPSGARLLRLTGREELTIEAVYDGELDRWVPTEPTAQHERYTIAPAADLYGCRPFLTATVGTQAHTASLTMTSDGPIISLTSSTDQPGWEQVLPGLFRSRLSSADAASISCQRFMGRWRDHYVVLLRDDGAHATIEYAGTDFAAAHADGFERIDRGIYRAEAASDEVTDRQVRAVPVPIHSLFGE